MQLTSLAKRLGFTTLWIGTPDPREAQPGSGRVIYNELELSTEFDFEGWEIPISDNEIDALETSAMNIDNASLFKTEYADFINRLDRYRDRMRIHGLLHRDQLIENTGQDDLAVRHESPHG